VTVVIWFVIRRYGSTQSCQCANMSRVLHEHISHLCRLRCHRRQLGRDVSARFVSALVYSSGWTTATLFLRSSSGNTDTTAESPHWTVVGLHHRTAHTGRQHSHAFVTAHFQKLRSLSTAYRAANRAFSVAASRAWTQLPIALKLMRSSATTFERHLKTFSSATTSYTNNYVMYFQGRI